MDKKQPRGEKKYFSDYAVGADGRVTYTGGSYRLRLAPGEGKKAKLFVSLMLLLAAALYITAGIAAGRPGRTFYVLLPYIAGFLPLGMALLAAAAFVATPGGMTRKQYDRGIGRLPKAALALGILAGAAALAGVIAFALAGFSAPYSADVLFIAGTASCASCAALIYRRAKEIAAKKEEEKGNTPS